MGKVYYAAGTRPEENGTGIAYKIYKQIDILKKENDVEFLYLGRDMSKMDRLVSKIPFLNRRIDLSALDKVEANTVLYIRYFLVDIWTYKKLCTIKKEKNVKIIIEFPTYPYDNEYKKFHPYILKDRFWRKYLHKFVDVCVTFSDDNAIYGIRAVNISNGVDTKKIQMRIPKNTSGEIHLIAVAKFAPWHGFDRIIDGMGMYYQKKPKHIIKFYIVGYGDKNIEENYKSRIKQYKLENYVFLLGEKHGKDLDELYNLSDIAIDSMGRHRSKVYYNSSLKGKEYMAKGLPIVSGVKTELDYVENYPYYLRVPADDSYVDMYDIIKFYNSIYKSIEADSVTKIIRKYCEDNFDIDKCFESVVKEIKCK